LRRGGWVTGNGNLAAPCFVREPSRVRAYLGRISTEYLVLDAVDIWGSIKAAPPTITSLSPSTGSTDGGNSVVINGTGFTEATGASAVTFDGVNATSYTVNSATKITATAPAHAAGSVPVQVSAPSGSATFPYRYVEVVVPTITSVSPGSGSTAGGTSVIITGTGFVGLSGAGAVTFGGLAAQSYTVNSDLKITAVCRAHVAGPVRVQVTALGGTTADTSADDFIYVAPPVKYQQTSTSLLYSGTWSTISTTSASGSSYKRSYTAGAYVLIPFNGTRLDWVALKSTSQGKADVYVDGVQVTDPLAPLDLYGATAYQKTVFSTGDLPAGYHTVKIQRSTLSATGKYINLDAAVVYGTLTAKTLLQQTDSHLVWTPDYTTWTNGTSSYLSGGSYRYINKAGSVTINFTGVSLELLCKKASSYGIASVSLDGGTAVPVNLYRSTTAYKQT
jgi:IPT/TIG domain